MNLNRRARSLMLLCLWSVLPAAFAEEPTSAGPATAVDASATVATSDAAGERAAATPDAPLRADVAIDPESGKFTLRYRFAEGQVLRYVTVDESVVDVHASEGATTVNYSTQTWKHYRVKAVRPDGRAVLVLTTDRVVMKAAGEGHQIEFDSSRPGKPPAEFASIVDTVGWAFAELTLTPTGQLTSVKFLLDHKDLGQSAPDRDLQVLTQLPEAPVAVGDTWTERFDVPVKIEGSRLQRSIKLQRNYKLTACENGQATIDLDTIVITPLHDPAIEAQLIQRTPSGAVTINLEQGLLTAKRTALANEVVGFNGPGSKLKVVRKCTETLSMGKDQLTAQSGAVHAAPSTETR